MQLANLAVACVTGATVGKERGTEGEVKPAGHQEPEHTGNSRPVESNQSIPSVTGTATSEGLGTEDCCERLQGFTVMALQSSHSRRARAEMGPPLGRLGQPCMEAGAAILSGKQQNWCMVLSFLYK